jgi:hypothetical protein
LLGTMTLLDSREFMHPRRTASPGVGRALSRVTYLLVSLAFAGCGGCGKTPPEPVVPDAAPAIRPRLAADGGLIFPAMRRDDAGHTIVLPPGMDEAEAGAPAKTSRDPDWDLDSDDAARDYVRRYAFGVRRYGDTLDCIDIGASVAAGDRRRVEAKTAASCPGAGTLRDVYLVDVAGDHLFLEGAAPSGAAARPLARWPDGSDPEGPPGAIREMEAMQKWKGPLKDALNAQLLVPIRLQTYGRGTYPVVTLAGWHGAINPSGPPDALRALAAAVCKANQGLPMGLFAGLDRSLLLRIRCPGSFRWEKL